MPSRASGVPVSYAQGEDAASGLATMMGTLLAQNVERSPAKRADLDALRGDLLIEVTDLGESVTMSFGSDGCVVHNGRIGRPTVSLRADSDTLMGLSSVSILPLGLPNYVDAAGRAVVMAMLSGRLVIGGLHHVGMLNRVTRLFSVV